MNYKQKCCFLLVLIIALYKPASAQTRSCDTVCVKCEEKMNQAFHNWDHAILNNTETKPVSFVQVFKVDNEEARNLALAKLTADTTYIGYISWRRNREEIRFMRQRDCWNKKVTYLNHGIVMTGKFWPKEGRVKAIKEHMSEIAYYYEVFYNHKGTLISVPALCLRTGELNAPIIMSSQFAN